MMRIRRFIASLAGRIALVLALGTIMAVVVALLVAGQIRAADYRRLRAERVLASAADIADRLRHDPDGTLRLMTRQGIIGATVVPPGVTLPPVDADLTVQLARRIRHMGDARLARGAPGLCHATDPFWRRSRAAGFGRIAASECWLMTIPLAGRVVTIGLDLPFLPPPPGMLADPAFLLLIAAGGVLLSIVAARIATLPLRRLTSASRAFALSIDADPVPEVGPLDVREALATFNVMQERVREGLRERTRLLAAISHDVQTPLTRLRLRLEQVPDEALRARLVDDLSATLRMVRRGLELARGSESGEEWSVVDLDSLLSSLTDDAAEVGHAVTYRGADGVRVRVKLDALTRCVTNLLDNAIKYAGGADLSCEAVGDHVAIRISDNGPGMSDEMLGRAFQPFVRGDRHAGGGSGIGLAIARAQAAVTGGELTLSNNRGGGLTAVVKLARVV